MPDILGFSRGPFDMQSELSVLLEGLRGGRSSLVRDVAYFDLVEKYPKQLMVRLDLVGVPGMLGVILLFEFTKGRRVLPEGLLVVEKDTLQGLFVVEIRVVKPRHITDDNESLLSYMVDRLV